MPTDTLPALHPAGEADFVFTTAGGQVALRTTPDALTPYGGLVPWAAFARHTGVIEQLAATCPVTRTSPNAKPIYDILHSFLLTALVDGRRFAHVERLREDPTVTELFGLHGVVGDDTIKRLFASIEEAAGAAWVAQAAAPLWQALPDRLHPRLGLDRADQIRPPRGRRARRQPHQARAQKLPPARRRGGRHAPVRSLSLPPRRHRDQPPNGTPRWRTPRARSAAGPPGSTAATAASATRRSWRGTKPGPPARATCSS
jgi:hypothetical protein